MRTRPLQILLVDDEAMLRLAIRLTLEDHGHHVVEAPDAEEGYRWATSRDFDVAILDVNMPGEGLRLLDRLRSEGILENRILMLTADLSRRRTLDHLAAAGTPLMGKPFDFARLVRAVEDMGAGRSPALPAVDLGSR